MPEAHLPSAVRPALSLPPPNFAAKDPGVGGWRHLFEQARGADAAGIDRLVVSDHVVLGENLEVYGDPKAGGTKGGVQPTGPDGQWLDPIVLLSMWAAVTKRTRFLTGILIAPLRRPATLAKQRDHLVARREDRLRVPHRDAPGLGQRERAGPALEQLLAECLLELLHLRRQCRRRHVEPAGRPGQVALLRDGPERVEVVIVESRHILN